MATFPRFEECFGIFTQSQNIALSTVYNEICGEDNKYLTLRRMISAYLLYKNNPNKTSTHLKNFFSLIFKQVLKKEKEYAGHSIATGKKFNTVNCKYHRAISKLAVLTDEEDEIKGLQMEYDNFFKNDLYNKRGSGDLYIKLEFKLEINEDKGQKGRTFNKKLRNRDEITHIFGTFSDKINFLGFKCTSGKKHQIGKPSGEPFLFGVFGKHFHYIKIEIANNGITKLEPFFAESFRENPHLMRKHEEINEDFLFNERPRFEEIAIGNYPNRQVANMASLHPFINDDYFTKIKIQDESLGTKYGDVCLYEKRYWMNKIDEIDESYPVSYQSIIDEADEEWERKRERKRRCEERNRKKADWERKIDKRKETERDDGRNKNFNLHVYGHYCECGNIIWDGVSVRGYTPSDFIYNEQNYERLLDRFSNSINSEISHERQKDIYEKNYNFYDDYIKKLGKYEETKSPSPKRYNDIEEMSDKMDLIREAINQRKKLNRTDTKYQYYIDDEDKQEKVKHDPEAEKKCIRNWNNMCKKIERSSGIFIIKTIGAVIKALHTIQNIEENFVDKTMTLNEKVKLFELLTSNKKIISFLTKAKEESEKHKKAQKIFQDQTNIEKDENDDEKPQVIIEELPKINKKLAYIEKLVKNNPNSSEKLIAYYDTLQKEKNSIVDSLNKEQEILLRKDTKYDNALLLKKEEEERKLLIEEENKRLEEQARLERERENERTKIVSFTNLEMPKDTKIYKKQKLCKEGETYTDDMFPPVKKSLCPINSKGSWVYPADITDEDLQDWDKFTWARTEEIFESKDFQVFHEGVDHDDIIQGGLGDCYFLSSIAALCKFPSLIEKLFYFKEKSQEHCYGVYLRINGIWSLVLVDDYIPCYDNWGKNFAFSSTNGNELWVILLEKAWAKINGSYAKIIGGQPHEVFDVITNAYSEKIDIVQKLSDRIWRSMIEGEAKGYIMTAGTSGDTYNLNLEDLGLVPGHAYTILGVREVKVAGKIEKLVYIRNPWGNGEWSGDWSDSSNKWTPALKKQLNVEKAIDDGEFYMSYNDFIKYYVVLGICKLHEDYQYSLLRTTREDAETGPFVSQVDIKDNKVNTFLQLHQKNPRIILRDGTFLDPVSNYLILCDSQFNFISASTNSEMNLCIEATLNKGIYYLISDINYRYVNPMVHSYNITSYSSNPVGLKKAETVNAEEALRKVLIDYAKKNVIFANNFGGKLYKSKKYSQEFPFTFCVFDNVSKKEMSLDCTITYRGKKCCAFYPGKDKDESKTQTKKIEAGKADVFIQMRFSPSAMCDYEIDSQTTTDESDISELVFNEESEALDEREEILQYVHEVDNGYFIGLENKSRSNLKLSLTLEGLVYQAEPSKTEIIFSLNKQNNKIFELKLKPKHRGDVSFQFDYA